MPNFKTLTIDPYQDWINATTGIPEPTISLLLISALFFVSILRRRS